MNFFGSTNLGGETGVGSCFLVCERVRVATVFGTGGTRGLSIEGLVFVDPEGRPTWVL